MFCPKCGAQNDENFAFCSRCGEPLAEAKEAVKKAAEAKASTPEPVPVCEAPKAAPIAAAAAPAAAGATPKPAATVQAQKGPVASAWRDIRESKGFGRLLLLALIALVPVLNFVVLGYALRWGAELAQGQNRPMPRELVCAENFKMGFFAWVYSLCWGFALGIVSSILAFIPFLGWIVDIAVAVLGSVMLYSGLLFMGINGTLGSAFQFKQIWGFVKRKPGQLTWAYLAPMLIYAAIITIVSTALCFASLGAILPGIVDYVDYYGVDYMASYLLYYYGGVLFLIFFVLYLIVALLTPITEVWALRGMAHVANRTMPEWKTGAFGCAAPDASAAPVAPASVQAAAPVATAATVAAAAASEPSVVPAPELDVQIETPQSLYASVADIKPFDVATPDYDAANYTKPEPELYIAPDAEPVKISDYVAEAAVVEAAAVEAAAEPVVAEPVVAAEPAAVAEPVVAADAPALTLVGKGGAAEFNGFPIILGRGAEADLVISGNSAVSNEHATITRVGSTFFVKDAGSANGTSVNRVPLNPGEFAILHDGDLLMLCDEEFVVKF